MLSEAEPVAFGGPGDVQGFGSRCVLLLLIVACAMEVGVLE